MNYFKDKIISSWYQGSRWWTYLLLPLSFLFAVVVKLRYFLYKKHFLKSIKSKVPVIIVGNLSVGGNGKTPLVIYIAALLQRHGYMPGIVLRGYGGTASTFQEVHPNTQVSLVGDEAVLLAKRTHCPVVVGRDRAGAVQTLLAHHDCNVIISDDGLQHYKMQRSLEIVVIDGKRRFGNRYCLPAGPLREPLSRLEDVDFVVCNGEAAPGEVAMKLQPEKLQTLATGAQLDLSSWRGKTVHAVAGIGNPQRFFATLRDAGINVLPHAFMDHHKFTIDDVKFTDALPVVMTEKDAVKCYGFADEKLWCLPVIAKLNAEFDKALLNKLKEK